MAELTLKQERFCVEYLVDYNATQAAIRAGYGEKSAGNQAHRLMKNDEVLARVRELQAEKVERLCITTDNVVLRLVDTLDKCMRPIPVTEWDYEEKKMVPTGEYTFDSRGATKCLELLGKHLGMFEEKVNLNAKLNTGQLDKVLAQLGGDPKDG